MTTKNVSKAKSKRSVFLIISDQGSVKCGFKPSRQENSVWGKINNSILNVQQLEMAIAAIKSQLDTDEATLRNPKKFTPTFSAGLFKLMIAQATNDQVVQMMKEFKEGQFEVSQ